MSGEPVDQSVQPYLGVQADAPALRRRIEDALRFEDFDRSIPIGVIGCGWVAGMQLEAYSAAGFNVVALCDHTRERATAYRDRFYPEAAVYDSERELLLHPGIQIVDIATHVAGRPELIRAALRAGKHVLSQKPFVESLATGSLLADEARAAGLALAVNQNGRWAPHFGALLGCVASGVIGTVTSADFFVAWPHDLVVADKPAFAGMADLVLFDFGAHWFDILGRLAPEGRLEVSAMVARRPGQAIGAPTQASAILRGEDFLGSLGFRAAERLVEVGSYRVSGTHGVITHSGQSLGGDEVLVTTAEGEARISIDGDWFSNGMTGTMRELLTAISAQRTPTHAAETSLRGLELCFAALRSAAEGAPVISGAATGRQKGRSDD
jgi:predicted dehydrogenase